MLAFYRKYALPIQLVLLIGIVVALAANGIYPSTKLGFALVVLWGVLNARVRAFVIDFAPFIVLLLSYSALRSFADNLSSSEIHIRDMIAWEKSLFGGTLPGYFLQKHLIGGTLTPVLDVLTNSLYLSHFITPVIAAGLLWRRKVSDYWAFALGLVALSYAGFLTYILFPAAPPWWATQHGYLDATPITLSQFVVSGETVSAAANPVAAMPSLHAAYPTYIALVCLLVWGKRALPAVLLPLGVIFSTVYLGHHYVIDAIAGAGYAAFFTFTVFLWARRRALVFDWFGKRKASSQAPHGI